MKEVIIPALVGAAVGGVIGGALAGASGIFIGAPVGAAALLGTLFLIFLYFDATKRKKRESVPPEVRGAMKRMIERNVGASGPTKPGSVCAMCGQPIRSGTGRMCSACVQLMSKNTRHSIHTCGGCGAGFQVAPNVNIYAFTFGGAERELCACCQVFLKATMPGGEARMPPLDPNYDREGQAINESLPELSVAEKLKHRAHQVQLAAALAHKARRTGMKPPEPIFLSK